VNRHALRCRRHPLAWIAIGTVALVALDVAAWLAYAAWRLAPLLAGAGAVVAYRRLRGRPILPPQGRGKVVPGQIVNEDAEREAQLRAELSRVRRQVADLEDLAGRDIGLIIADYQRAQARYGPAMSGKTGGTR
jgi:hypothetical protein